MAEKRYSSSVKSKFQDLLAVLATVIGALAASPKQEIISPLPDVTPTPTPTPTPAPYEEAIRKGFEKYGNPPAAKYTPYFVEAVNKYPPLKKHPYLLPALSIVETSGGKNVTYKENLFNWGKQDMPSVPYVIERVAKGISEDPRYAKFRETGRIEDLAEVYAPRKENPNFIKNLIWALNLFKGK